MPRTKNMRPILRRGDTVDSNMEKKTVGNPADRIQVNKIPTFEETLLEVGDKKDVKRLVGLCLCLVFKDGK